jgi:hypothetical protein
MLPLTSDGGPLKRWYPIASRNFVTDYPKMRSAENFTLSRIIFQALLILIYCFLKFPLQSPKLQT